jgi:hypothetical protein
MCCSTLKHSDRATTYRLKLIAPNGSGPLWAAAHSTCHGFYIQCSPHHRTRLWFSDWLHRAGAIVDGGWPARRDPDRLGRSRRLRVSVTRTEARRAAAQGEGGALSEEANKLRDSERRRGS